ncbi:hypothetical protein ACLF3G_26080, partial [Falsiroseomonas sp. HC035]|uniref:hypothetical protein n=1 Tax=Falsiroseomonas sp. HC035 TaxID=3390999 RepID=UPI003D314BE4
METKPSAPPATPLKLPTALALFSAMLPVAAEALSDGVVRAADWLMPPVVAVRATLVVPATA